MKKKFSALWILGMFSMTLTADMITDINKVIIWGHKLHSHTHSYIHYAFFKAFKHMGYDTYWFDQTDNVKNFDFSHSLFITEGQADKNIPLREDCRYILHNCTDPKYKKLPRKNSIILQVYTHDALKNHAEIHEMAPFVLYNVQDKTIYMPWATDLLPHEIDAIKATINVKAKKERVVYWIGTTTNELNQLRQACQKNKVQLLTIDPWTKPASPEENIKLIQKSLFAPAIQSQWQCENGYIPCRIFKNISYGQMGITNSETVYRLFNKKIIFNPDIQALVSSALEKVKTIDSHEIFELMDFVRDNHTYLNRIKNLLKFMNMVN